MKRLNRALLYQAVMQSNMHPTTKSFLGSILKAYKAPTVNRGSTERDVDAYVDWADSGGDLAIPIGAKRSMMEQHGIPQGSGYGPFGPFQPDDVAGYVRANRTAGDRAVHPDDILDSFNTLTGQQLTEQDLDDDSLFALNEARGRFDGGPGGDGHGELD